MGLIQFNISSCIKKKNQKWKTSSEMWPQKGTWQSSKCVRPTLTILHKVLWVEYIINYTEQNQILHVPWADKQILDLQPRFQGTSQQSFRIVLKQAHFFIISIIKVNTVQCITFHRNSRQSATKFQTIWEQFIGTETLHCCLTAMKDSFF